MSIFEWCSEHYSTLDGHSCYQSETEGDGAGQMLAWLA